MSDDSSNKMADPAPAAVASYGRSRLQAVGMRYRGAVAAG